MLPGMPFKKECVVFVLFSVFYCFLFRYFFLWKLRWVLVVYHARKPHKERLTTIV